MFIVQYLLRFKVLVMANTKNINCMAQIRPQKDAKFNREGYTLAIVGPADIQIGALKVLLKLPHAVINIYLAFVQSNRRPAPTRIISDDAQFAQKITVKFALQSNPSTFTHFYRAHGKYLFTC